MIIALCLAYAYMIMGFANGTAILYYTQALGNRALPFTIDESEREWDFGQLLPMFLLALPVLGGLEVACGK